MQVRLAIMFFTAWQTRFVLLGIHGDGIGSTDALVARTGVGHHRNHGATHTGVAGQSCLGDDVREDRLAEDAVTQRAVDGLTQAVAVVAFFALFGRTDIVVACLQDEADIIERCCGGKVPHHAQGQLQLFFLGTAAKASPLVKEHLAAGFFIDEMGVAAGNDRRCHVAVSLASDLDRLWQYVDSEGDGAQAKHHGRDRHGTVELATVSYSFKGGYYVTINHGFFVCSYLHLSKILVGAGQRVSAGQPIAVSGNSGRNTTGPHLHVSCRWGGNKGKYFDPALILEYITTQLTNM